MIYINKFYLQFIIFIISLINEFINKFSSVIKYIKERSINIIIILKAYSFINKFSSVIKYIKERSINIIIILKAYSFIKSL